MQPGLHHHTLLHPLPAGKSPAAGWPLSTGLVLLHEMNRCGVGVGERGCRECSRGSSCLGVPGDSRELLSSQPAWLATAVPRGLLDLALSPRRAAAAPQTPAAMRALALSLCVTHWDLSRHLHGAHRSHGCVGGEDLLWQRMEDPSKATGTCTPSSPTQHRPAALWALVKPNQTLPEAINT